MSCFTCSIPISTRSWPASPKLGWAQHWEAGKPVPGQISPASWLIEGQAARWQATALRRRPAPMVRVCAPAAAAAQVAGGHTWLCLRGLAHVAPARVVARRGWRACANCGGRNRPRNGVGRALVPGGAALRQRKKALLPSLVRRTTHARAGAAPRARHRHRRVVPGGHLRSGVSVAVHHGAEDAAPGHLAVRNRVGHLHRRDPRVRRHPLDGAAPALRWPHRRASSPHHAVLAVVCRDAMRPPVPTGERTRHKLRGRDPMRLFSSPAQLFAPAALRPCGTRGVLPDDDRRLGPGPPPTRLARGRSRP